MKITAQFFKNNPVSKVSPAWLEKGMLIMTGIDRANLLADEIVLKYGSEDRISKLRDERQLISEADTTEDIINYMRKNSDISARNNLLKKIKNKQEEIMPEILKYYYRNKSDSFLETASAAIFHTDMKYTVELYRNYKKIDSPYARAIACLIFGMRKADQKDRLIDFLYGEFNFFKEQYKNEKYHEYVILALDEVCNE